MISIYNDIMTMIPKYETFGENLYWSYASWQMIFATAKSEQEKFGRTSYIIRQGCYKKLCEGKQHITDLYKMNQSKMRADGYCFYCHKEMPKTELTLDHVFPRAKGGVDAIDNIIFTCRNCNSSKGKLDLVEWFLVHRHELPSPFVLGHYLRQINLYAIDNELMSLSFENVCQMALPFNPRSILLPIHNHAALLYLEMAKQIDGNDYNGY